MSVLIPFSCVVHVLLAPLLLFVYNVCIMTHCSRLYETLLLIISNWCWSDQNQILWYHLPLFHIDMAAVKKVYWGFVYTLSGYQTTHVLAVSTGAADLSNSHF